MFVSKRRYNDLVIKNTINADRGDRYYAKWLHEIDMYKSAKREAGAAEKVLAHTEQHLRSAENALQLKDEKLQRQAREIQALTKKIIGQRNEIKQQRLFINTLTKSAAEVGLEVVEIRGQRDAAEWQAEQTEELLGQTVRMLRKAEKRIKKLERVISDHVLPLPA